MSLVLLQMRRALLRTRYELRIRYIHHAEYFRQFIFQHYDGRH